MESKPLLLISCSKTKWDYPKPVMAWNRYRGRVYRALKNKWNVRSHAILILSAKYGIIEPETEISYYDQYLSGERAEELTALSETKKRVMDAVAAADNVCICMEGIYFNVIAPHLCSAIRIRPHKIDIRICDLWDLDKAVVEMLNWLDGIKFG